MAPRLFALIVGIDIYRSGDIWNLESCVQDAKRIQRWLMNDLKVPSSQICTLLDNQATKQTIEASFTRHFLHNPDAQPGDSFFLYFAGHGSILPAPTESSSASPHLEVLCSYDHDTKDAAGRVVGLSAPHLHALIAELAAVKGNNITLFLDCCFSPMQSRSNIRDRRITRWTPTSKNLSSALLTDVSPVSPPRAATKFHDPSPNCMVLAACNEGFKAIEGKNGGRFTYAFLHAAKTLPLHELSYKVLISTVNGLMAEGQHAICTGSDTSCLVFDAIPFTPDARFVPLVLQEDTASLRMEAGSIHGVTKGGEISVHKHNCCGSHNPSIARLLVLEVHPTWSRCAPLDHKAVLASGNSPCWALITRLKPRRSLSSTFSRSSVRKSRSASPVTMAGEVSSTTTSSQSGDKDSVQIRPITTQDCSMDHSAGLRRVRKGLREFLSAAAYFLDLH